MKEEDLAEMSGWFDPNDEPALFDDASESEDDDDDENADDTITEPGEVWGDVSPQDQLNSLLAANLDPDDWSEPDASDDAIRMLGGAYETIKAENLMHTVESGAEIHLDVLQFAVELRVEHCLKRLEQVPFQAREQWELAVLAWQTLLHFIGARREREAG